MSEVVSRLKPDPVECPCSCGRVAQPRVKQWKDGLSPHVRGCACRRCTGGRQKPKAAARERKLAKALGGERHVMSGALSGIDVSSPLVVIEETANRSLVRGFFSWWGGKGVQSKTKRLMENRSGLPRCFVVVNPDNAREAYGVIPVSDLPRFLRETSEGEVA